MTRHHKALFIDGPAAGRVLEVPRHSYPISVPVATSASSSVHDAGPAPDIGPTFEKAEYYEARTRDLPFGFSFYSLNPMRQESWAYGIKLLELEVTKDREEFEQGVSTRVALAESRVAELSREVSDFRFTMSRLGDAITLVLPPRRDEE